MPAAVPSVGKNPGVVSRNLPGFLVQLGLAGLLIFTAWVWAGLRPSLHLAAVCMAVLVLILLLAAGRREGRRALARDPVFWLGWLFLGYVSVQCANAGRELYFDVGLKRWTYSPARWPEWPWAFDRAESLQMLTWFFPAWIVALAVRSPLVSGRSLRQLLLVVAYSSGLLGLLGLAQFVSHTKAIYWLVDPGCVFFASFAYANHAAAYFVLTAALTAGLLFHELFRGGRNVRRWRVALLSCSMVSCLTGANLSLSRAGVIMAWAFGLFSAAYGLARGWLLLPPVGRVYLAAFVVAGVCIFYFVVSGFGEQSICKEFTAKAPTHHALAPALGKVNLELGDRGLLLGAAMEIWRDHRWLGVGGWGYRRLVAFHVPETSREDLRRAGKANVHCDFIQFLVEFGVAGFGLLLGALGWMVLAVDCRGLWRDPLRLMCVIGLALVAVLSLIDLPFRCPAILYVWVLALAALPRLYVKSMPVTTIS